jgi:hypothetical protein
MKKICTFMAVLMVTFLFVGNSNAQLFTEDFSYTGAIAGQNGWVNIGGTTTNPITIAGTSGLSYTSGSPYAGSGVGGLVNMTNTGQDLVNTFGASGALTTGSVYYSAMINVSAAQASGDYFINLGDGTSSIFFGKIHAKSIGGSGFEFGLSKQKNSSVTDASAPLWTAANYSYGSTHFVVVKYTFVAGLGQDNVTLYVDPAIGSTEALATVTLGPTSDNGNTSQASLTTGVMSIDLRQGTATVAPTFQIDGIRVGITWGSVTPAGGVSSTLIPTPNAINGLYYLIGTGPSATTGTSSYSLSGSNLTGSDPIIVTASNANFQVSASSSGPWGSTFNITRSGATLGATPVWVRLAGGITPVGPYSGSIKNAGGGVADMEVPVSGAVVTQTLDVSLFANVGLSYVFGSGPSGAADYSLSGSYLTPATGFITITAPTNFEVSLDNIAFAATQSVAYGSVTAGVLATTPVYVRLKAGLPITSYGPGNLTFAGGGATTQNVSISGFVGGGPLLFSDDFVYSTGSLNGTGGWVAHSGVGDNPILITTPGLTFTGLAGSGVGNAVTETGTGEDCNHQFTNINSGTVYASAMLNVSTASTAGDYFMHFSDAGTFNFYARTYVKSSSTGKFEFGIGKYNEASPNYTPTEYNIGQTYLVVIKYSFVTGSTANDIAYLYVNPTPGAVEPAPDLTTGSTLVDAENISGIFLRQGGSTGIPTVIIDGIKVGQTWASVTPVTMLTLTAFLEGYTNTGGTAMNFGNPAVTVELRNASTYALVTSSTSYLNTNGIGKFPFGNAVDGTNYYLAVKTWNTIETWSKTVQQFNTNGILSYDFTSAATQAYANNLTQIAGAKWCIFSGDVDQDHYVGTSDLIAVNNDSYNLVRGYFVTDVTGDLFTSITDLIIVNNNSYNLVRAHTPLFLPGTTRIINGINKQPKIGK